MYYELHGEGEPLLLIRGLGSTCEGFAAQVEGLAPHFRVISFDNRCVGRTDQPQQLFTIADMADDTAALLDALEVENAHVFGVSLGGMVAQEFVLRHPHKVKRLVLACTHAGPRTATRAPEWALQIFNESRDMPRAAALRYSIPLLFAKRTIEEQPELVEETLRVMARNNQPKPSYLLQLGAVMMHDTFDRLFEIKHATLVMTGTEDTLVDPANSRLISERIPGARLVEFPETGHVFFTEKPDDVNRVLI
ncbi:MAG TPA: alpha/beta hydrolase, partial [Blastocatellia bacterium]|nr:alpha/beta hydrolase [Blastocatellia bacterium]